MHVLLSNRFDARARLAAFLSVAVIASFATLASAPASASADTLALDTTHAAACPACMTENGSARVVNFFKSLADATGTSVTYSGPVADFGYAEDASAMLGSLGRLSGGTSPSMTTLEALRAQIAGAAPRIGGQVGVLPRLGTIAGLSQFAIPVGVGVGAGLAIGYGSKWLIQELWTGGEAPASTYSSPRGMRISAPPVSTSGLFGYAPFSSNSAMTDFCSDGCWQFQLFGGSTTSWQTQGGYCDDQVLSSDPRHHFVDNLQSTAGFQIFSAVNGDCSTWGMNTHVGLANEESLQRTGATISDTVPDGYITAPGVTTVPSDSSLFDSISAAINSGGTTFPAWINYQRGDPGASDPTEVGDDNPNIPFGNRSKKYDKHVIERGEFGQKYDDPVDGLHEYWEDAAEIVQRGEDPEDDDVEPCDRTEPGREATIYWKSVAGADADAVVIVTGGEIQTYFEPTDVETFLDENCDEPPGG